MGKIKYTILGLVLSACAATQTPESESGLEFTLRTTVNDGTGEVEVSSTVYRPTGEGDVQLGKDDNEPAMLRRYDSNDAKRTDLEGKEANYDYYDLFPIGGSSLRPYKAIIVQLDGKTCTVMEFRYEENGKRVMKGRPETKDCKDLPKFESGK